MVAVLMQANVHEESFKAMFSGVEHAASVLQRILPAKVAARIDFNTLALCTRSFVDEALKERSSDLLFSATIGGRSGLIYLLSEPQSTSDGRLAYLRVRTMVRIWESWQKENPTAKRPPVIVTVVLPHSLEGWVGSTAFEDLLNADEKTSAALAKRVRRFQLELEDISHQTDEALNAPAMIALPRLTLWYLRHAREPQELVERLLGWVALMREVSREPHKPTALVPILAYLLVTSESKPDELTDQFLAAMGIQDEEELMTPPG